MFLFKWYEHGRGYGCSIGRSELKAFKARWPDSGIADAIWRVYFAWNSKGELVDMQAFYRNGRRAEEVKADGPAWAALRDGAHEKMRPGDLRVISE